MEKVKAFKLSETNSPEDFGKYLSEAYATQTIEAIDYHPGFPGEYELFTAYMICGLVDADKVVVDEIYDYDENGYICNERVVYADGHEEPDYTNRYSVWNGWAKLYI